MSSVTKPEFYSVIVSAQQNDCQSNYGKAFVLYLDGINGLTNYLKNEAINKLDTIGTERIDPKLVSGVNTLKNCVERLLTITKFCDNNNGNDCIDSEDEMVSKLCQQSINGLDSVQSKPQNTETQDSEVDSNGSNPMSSMFSLNLQKALKENAFLNKVFETRLRRTPDPFKRASLKLELQRRIAENIELAKNKDKEYYHSMHLQQRQALESAAKKLIQQQNVLNLDNESMICDNQSQQQLYAQILDFESKNVDLSQQFRCLSLTPDKSVIIQIIIRVLKCKEHPLTEWIDKFQRQIIHIINPLLKQYLKRREINSSESDVQSYSSQQSLNSFDLMEEMVIKISDVELEALTRHLTNISSDISISHETITLMLTLIMFDNQLYYKPSNYDLFREQHFLVHTIVSHYFYPPIWTAFKFLFRIVFNKHEKQLKEGIIEFIKTNELNNEFEDSFDDNLMEETIVSLKSLIELQSPYEKLKSMVRLIQNLCTKLKSHSEDSTEVSADDLIPALCQVVVKSGYHQLISECYAIEQLVDQKYLLGEEGYCLSSIMTALKYIQMHSSSYNSGDIIQ